MLYDIKRDGVTLIEHEIKGKRIKSAPAVDYIEVEFDYFEPVLLKKNDTIEFKGEVYYCDKQSVNVFKKSTNLYNHRARFLGENYKATEIALLSPDFYEHNFDIEGNLQTLVTLAVSNLNRIDSGWSFDEDLPATITKKFEIKEENVMSFLAKLSGEFEIPFRIENKVITFAYYEHPDGGEFEYGKGKGFLDLKKSYRNGEKAPNTIFATGGNGFQLNDPIQDDDDVDENGVIEGFYTNERIYPTTRANVLGSVQSNIFRTDLDFSIYNNSIPGQRPLINFETGALAGLSFFLQNEQYDIEGFKILTITKRYVDGVEYPNLTARPLGGDRYNITNITMPQDAIDDATDRLTIATQNYLRNILDRNLVLDANLDPLYQEALKLNDRIKIVDVDLDINGYFIINEIKEDLQNLNRKEITLDYVGRNLLNLNLPVVNDNIIEVEIEEINTEIQDIIVETGRLKVEVGNKVDFENVVGQLSDTNPLNIPNVSAVNEGLYQTLSTANEYTDTAVEGAVYNVTYENGTHAITFYRHQQPNIVIDLPIEQLITGVELVGNDLVFTFEDGSEVTVPMNTLLVGVVKKVNGLTPNSQGEVVINIADIPGLSTELNKIGALTTLTTTDKSNLVNAINEVNGNIPNVTGLVPYTGADQSVDLNTQSLTIGGDFEKRNTVLEQYNFGTGTGSANNLRRYKNVASYIGSNGTSAGIIRVVIPIHTNTMWNAQVSIQEYSASTTYNAARRTTLKLGGYSTASTGMFVICDNPDRIAKIEYGRDSSANTIVHIYSNSGSFMYERVIIDWVQVTYPHSSELNNKTSYSVSFIAEADIPTQDFDLRGAVLNSEFQRDSYLWNKGDFTQTNVDNWNTAFGWGDFRDYGLGIRSDHNSDSNDSRLWDNGFYTLGPGSVNRPSYISSSYASGILTISETPARRVQIATGGDKLNRLSFRSLTNTTQTDWIELYHTGNFNPAQYVLQSALNTQLANYVPINGVTTINNTKTFTSSPIVPNATLNSHAVNLGQLNTILGDYATEEWVNQQIGNIEIPTVNDGQLSLTTGTGLTGSVTFRANQSHNSSFLVAIASTHKLPTLAEWNALPTTDTITRLRGTSSGTYTSGDLTLLAGANTTITQSGANITIASTNTTYSAGTLELLQAGTNATNRVWSPKTLADGVIRKGVNNVNPAGQPFSIEANNGRLSLNEWGRFRFEEFGDQDCFFEFRHDEGPGLVVGHNHTDYEGTLAMGYLRFYGNGVVNTLSHNLNGYSRTKLPVTGSDEERTLAVGATMGGNTYYANDNGLISLPNVTPPTIDTTVKVYMPGEVANNDTVSCNASKTIIYLSDTFTGPLTIDIDPNLQDGAELIVIHTSNEDFGLFNINGDFISHEGQLISTYQASQSKTYRFIHVKDLERFALVAVGQI